MTSIYRVIVVVFVAVCCLTLFVGIKAAHAQYTAGAGLTSTPHDFTTDGGLTETIGLCTFCHTPHKASQTALLWNHKVPSGVTYSWSDQTNTTNGTPLPSFSSDTYRGVSKLCLSCHDGSVAPGMVNWYRAAGSRDLGGPGAITGARQIGGGGDMAGNHPVAHPYPYANTPSTYNGVTQPPEVTDSGWQSTPEASGIRLFIEAGDGSVSAGNSTTLAANAGSIGIECSSCHDPHNGSTVQDIYFLRGTIDGAGGSNYICLKCHNK